MPCKRKWPICYKALEQYKHAMEQLQAPVFRCNFVLSNFKVDYFTKRPTAIESAARPRPDIIPEDEILIERQTHTCECFDHELEEKRSKVRALIANQIANHAVNNKTTEGRKSPISQGSPTLSARSRMLSGEDMFSEEKGEEEDGGSSHSSGEERDQVFSLVSSKEGMTPGLPPKDASPRILDDVDELVEEMLPSMRQANLDKFTILDSLADPVRFRAPKPNRPKSNSLHT